MRFRWTMEDMLAEIVLRIIYFVGTFVMGFFLFIDDIGSPLFWIALFIFALLAAFFGPNIYTEEKNTGRGMLKHIREKSKRR